MIKFNVILVCLSIVLPLYGARASDDSTAKIEAALKSVKASVKQLELALNELKKEDPKDTSSIESLGNTLEKDLKSLSLEIKSIEDQLRARGEPMGKKLQKDFAGLLRQIGTSITDAAKKIEANQSEANLTKSK